MNTWRRFAISLAVLVGSAVLLSAAVINCAPGDITYYPLCDAGDTDGGGGAGGAGGSGCQ